MEQRYKNLCIILIAVIFLAAASGVVVYYRLLDKNELIVKQQKHIADLNLLANKLNNKVVELQDEVAQTYKKHKIEIGHRQAKTDQLEKELVFIKQSHASIQNDYSDCQKKRDALQTDKLLTIRNAEAREADWQNREKTLLGRISELDKQSRNSQTNDETQKANLVAARQTNDELAKKLQAARLETAGLEKNWQEKGLVLQAEIANISGRLVEAQSAVENLRQERDTALKQSQDLAKTIKQQRVSSDADLLALRKCLNNNHTEINRLSKLLEAKAAALQIAEAKAEELDYRLRCARNNLQAQIENTKNQKQGLEYLRSKNGLVKTSLGVANSERAKFQADIKRLQNKLDCREQEELQLLAEKTDLRLRLAKLEISPESLVAKIRAKGELIGALKYRPGESQHFEFEGDQAAAIAAIKGFGPDKYEIWVLGYFDESIKWASNDYTNNLKIATYRAGKSLVSVMPGLENNPLPVYLLAGSELNNALAAEIYVISK